MIKKLFLVGLVAAGATASIPPLRARAAPHVEPVFEEVVIWWGDQLKPVLDPVFRWSAMNEARTIARELREREVSLRPLPDPDSFHEYIKAHHLSGRDGRDPWGVPYFLLLKFDSIVVGSAGPDLTRGTEDDVVVGIPRR